MKNVEMKMNGKNVLEIKVDLTKEFGQSKSGKTVIIATTEGNQPVTGLNDVKVGLNIYRPVNAEKSLEGALFNVLGNNITGSVKDNILTLKVDTAKNFGMSKSGKSKIIATTSGNVGIGLGSIKCGLNVYTPVRN